MRLASMLAAATLAATPIATPAQNYPDKRCYITGFDPPSMGSTAPVT